MIPKIQLENTEESVLALLKNVGTDKASVIQLQGGDLDVVVVAKDEWLHLLELLDAERVAGYRLSDDLPETPSELAIEPETTAHENDIVLDDPERLHPDPDYPLDSEEVKESDDILD